MHYKKKDGLFSIFNNLSATWQIIIINIIFFIFSFLCWILFPDTVKYFAMIPAYLVAGKYPWTLVTHMFVHSGFFHLAFNMFSLFFLGGFCERIIGRKRFVWFYLIAGLFAGLLAALSAAFFGQGLGARIFGTSDVAMVGASGALFGLVGMLAVLIPFKRVYLIAGPLIAIIIQAVLGMILPSSAILGLIDVAITIYIFVSIFSIFSFNPASRRIAVPVEMPFWILPIVAIVPLTIVSFFVSLPIGNVAHFGGLLAGLVYGGYLRIKYRKKVMMLERMFSY